MRRLIAVSLFVCLCGAGFAGGQETSQQDRFEGFVLPGEIILPVVASQPDCPLLFEDVRHVKFIIGGSGDVYQLRNRGTKPIRSYTIAWLSTSGPEAVSTWPRKKGDELFLPGQVHPRPGDGDRIKLVPLTEQLRKEVKLPEGMQGVSVLMVVRVEYADGSVYSDEKTHKALQNYFKNIATAVELRERQRR